MTVVASWNACATGIVDGALVGTVLGLVAGVVVGEPFGWLLLPAGLAMGIGVSAGALRRRSWVELDDDGLRSSTVRRLHEVPWSDVVAVGLVPGRVGRSGRSWSVGICRRGHEDVLRLPALSVRTPIVQRLGDDAQAQRTEDRRDHLLDPMLPFAAEHGLEVTDGDLVAWWDRHRRL